MLQFEAWKKTLVILVAALGIIYAAPNLLPVEREGGGILPGQKINLGLDLQGGSHLLLRRYGRCRRGTARERCRNHQAGVSRQEDQVQRAGCP